MQDNQDAKKEHVIVNNYTTDKAQSNPMGTAGFICALVDLFIGWVPFIGWLLWIVGAALSIVGIFRNPKGLAIAGAVISFIDVIIILVIASSIASISSMF
ncbi:hypothetical protein [Companilactobacillus jidongensis]|uniref:hypothetical protein n=1 Tax=Companilactobacillus jidongensis TaxID=2486006 RepID=UPI000F78D169|nr:hypothetical protein [Companilactobacillus jidongensis]